MTTETNDFLLGSGAPSAGFPTVGTTVKGVVVSTRVRAQTDIKTNEVLRFADGNPRQMLEITLATEERDPQNEDDDGQRRVFAKAEMLKAIREVVRPYKGITPGGTLAITYTGDGVAAQRGFNPPKLYAAVYTPPPQTVAVPDDEHSNGATAGDLMPGSRITRAFWHAEVGPLVRATLDGWFSGDLAAMARHFAEKGPQIAASFVAVREDGSAVLRLGGRDDADARAFKEAIEALMRERDAQPVGVASGDIDPDDLPF